MPVKVEVRLDVESMTEFMLYHIYTGSAGALTLVLGALNIGLTVSFALGGKYLYAVLFLVFTLLILLAFPKFIKSKVKRQMEGATKLKEPLNYEFNDEGVATVTTSDRKTKQWDQFKKAVSRKKTIILYDHSRRAIILPVEQLGESYTAVVDMIAAHMPGEAVKIIRTDGKK